MFNAYFYLKALWSLLNFWHKFPIVVISNKKRFITLTTGLSNGTYNMSGSRSLKSKRQKSLRQMPEVRRRSSWSNLRTGWSRRCRRRTSSATSSTSRKWTRIPDSNFQRHLGSSSINKEQEKILKVFFKIWLMLLQQLTRRFWPLVSLSRKVSL